MESTAARTGIDLTARPARPVLALVLALISVPGSTLSWETLPGGGFVFGLPFAIAAIVLGVQARAALGSAARRGVRRCRDRRRDGRDDGRLDRRRGPLSPAMRARTTTAALAALLLALAGCGDEADEAAPAASAPDSIDRVVKIDGDRGLYLRCTGRGSPTVVMEGGDGDTSDSYAFRRAGRVRGHACVRLRPRRARQERSAAGPARPARARPRPRAAAPRGRRARAVRPRRHLGRRLHHRRLRGGPPARLGGLVFVDTYSPFRDPPRAIVEETAPAIRRTRSGATTSRSSATRGPPAGGSVTSHVKVITARPPAAAIRESPFRSERRAMRGNVGDQKGWLVLSARAEQIVVDGGHAIEEEDPRLVIDAILATVAATR